MNLVHSILLSKLACPLIKLAIRSAKNVLLPFGLTAAASAANTGIPKSVYKSGSVHHEEMEDIMQITKLINRNIAGHFESSFFGGGINLTIPFLHISRITNLISV